LQVDQKAGSRPFWSPFLLYAILLQRFFFQGAMREEKRRLDTGQPAQAGAEDTPTPWEMVKLGLAVMPLVAFLFCMFWALELTPFFSSVLTFEFKLLNWIIGAWAVKWAVAVVYGSCALFYVVLGLYRLSTARGEPGVATEQPHE
jgi:hypothetical protein